MDFLDTPVRRLGARITLLFFHTYIGRRGGWRVLSGGGRDAVMEHNIPGVGVIGCGYWGSKLVRDLHGLGCLRRICRPSTRPCLRELGARYSVPFTNSYNELLQDPEIQGIVIAAPPPGTSSSRGAR